MVLPEVQGIQRAASHPGAPGRRAPLPAANPADVPALLLRAEYNGTLAAARCVARNGAAVTVATSSLLAHARWSRAVTRVAACPGFCEGPRIVAGWLLSYGRQYGPTVLYPTCDETAWLISQYRDQLAAHFYLYSPERQTLRSVLDKRDLYAAASAVGIDVPRTWHPREEEELEPILRESGAVIVKPRSQTFFLSQKKGVLARQPAELRDAWHEYRNSRYAAEVAADMGDVRFPMVQEYLPLAHERVESISGFVNGSGVIIEARASRKLLQMPPSAGVGLCFESIEPDPRLVDLLAALCRSVNYYGVFEAEFVHSKGRALLIDFNPRYFGQMEFDIARGMPLPWLVHLHATGNESLTKGASGNSIALTRRVSHFADSSALRWYLNAGLVLGVVSQRQRRRWLDWLETGARSYADSVRSSMDRGPSIASAMARIWRAVRHPLGFWRSIRDFRQTRP